MLSSQHHAHSAAVCAGDVDDVGDLAGPVDEAAVDVDAQVVQLQPLTGPAQRARHHRHTLTGRQHGPGSETAPEHVIFHSCVRKRLLSLPGFRPPERGG